MIKRIYLEITDACNLNCPFCRNTKGHTFMSFDDVKMAVNQICEITDYIYLHVLGEPLMHPDFDRILDLLDQKGLKLQLVTNGVLLAQHPDLLKHQCLRKLSVSVHSINNIQVPDSYFDVLDKLISEESNTVIELRFYGDHLDDKLSLYLNKLKDTFSLSNTSKNNSYKLKNNVYLYFEKFFKWPDISDPFISKHGRCLGAINMLAILHTFDVTICCLDPKGNNKIGNIKEKSLISIVDSDSYINVVNNLRNSNLTFELCQKCSYRSRFDDNSN